MDEKTRFEDEFADVDLDDLDIYEAFPVELQQNLQSKVADATARAPEEVRAGVQESADELYAAMDEMKTQEKESVPAPEAWEGFVSRQGQAIRDNLAELASLTGAAVSEEAAKTNAEKRMDEILSKMENVMASFHSGAQFFQDEKARLADRERKMSETMGHIVTSVTSLQKELGREDLPDERKLQVAALLKQSYDMLDSFRLARNELLSNREKAPPRRVADATGELYEDLGRVRESISACVTTAKKAVRRRADRMLDHIVQRTSSFVRSANDGFGKIVRAGVRVYTKGRGLEQWIEGFSPAFDQIRTEKMADRYLMKALAEKPYSGLGVYELMERHMTRDGVPANQRQSVFRELVEKASRAASVAGREENEPVLEEPALVR